MKRLLFSIIVLVSFSSLANALPTYDEVRQSYVKSDSCCSIAMERSSMNCEWTKSGEGLTGLPSKIFHLS